MKRHFLIGAAMLIAIFLGWFAWDGWLYLQRGYSLSVSMTGHKASVFHIDFPMWRSAVHIFLWLLAMAAILAYLAGRSRASTLAWLAFAATSVIGIYDMMQFGTIGSPTSIWAVLLLLLFALLTRFGALVLRAKA